MGRLDELRRQAQRKTGNLYDTYFTRRVSIYLTLLLSRLGVSPNGASAAGLLCGLLACALIAAGTTWSVVAGVLGMHLYAVLDSVDGELARVSGRFSLKGLFLEDLSAYLTIHAFWLAVACYLWRTQELLWPLLCAVLLIAFFRNAMPVARRAILKSVKTRRPPGPRAAPGETGNGGELLRRGKALAGGLLHYTNVWVALTTLLLLETFGGPALVAPGFAAAAAAMAMKELAILALFLFTGALDGELAKVYESAARVPSGEPDGFQLSGDRPPSDP